MKPKVTQGVPLSKTSRMLITTIGVVLMIIAAVVAIKIVSFVVTMSLQPVNLEDYTKRVPVQKQFSCVNMKVLDIPVSLSKSFMEPGPNNTFIVAGQLENSKLQSYTLDTNGNVISTEVLPEYLNLEEYANAVNYVPLVDSRSQGQLTTFFDNTYKEYNNFPNGPAKYISKVTLTVNNKSCASSYYLIDSFLPITQSKTAVLFRMDRFPQDSTIIAIIEEKP